MTRGLRPPTARWFPSWFGRAALAALVALSALGCETLGLSEKDPMRAELRRLDREQRAKAAEEQRIEAARDKKRAEHPETMEGLIARGDASLAQGHLAAAVWSYAGAYRLDPEATAPRERLGYVHLRQNPERAQPLFESALEIDPNSLNAHIGLGLSLLASGNRDEGLRHLERAVELDPMDLPSRENLAIALLRADRVEEAEANLRRALAIDPDAWLAHYYLAGALDRLGRSDEVIEQLRETVRLRPGFRPAQKDLEAVLAARGAQGK